MENAKKVLAHLKAALDIADTQKDYLIGAHLTVPIQILADRIKHNDRPGEAGSPKAKPET